MKNQLPKRKKSTAMRVFILLIAVAMLLGFIVLPLMQ